MENFRYGILTILCSVVMCGMLFVNSVFAYDNHTQELQLCVSTAKGIDLSNHYYWVYGLNNGDHMEYAVSMNYTTDTRVGVLVCPQGGLSNKAYILVDGVQKLVDDSMYWAQWNNGSSSFWDGYSKQYADNDCIDNIVYGANSNIRDAKTNVPLFMDNAALLVYLNTGDTSNAVNKGDISSVKYDVNVELPKDLSCTKNDKDDNDLYFDWKQSDGIDLTGYVTEIWAKPTYNLKSFLVGSQFGKNYSMTIDIKKYKTVATYVVNRANVDKFATTQDDYVICQSKYSDINFAFSSFTLDKCDFYIRNVKDGKYVSNWIRVEQTNDGWYVRPNNTSTYAPKGSYVEIDAVTPDGKVIIDPSVNPTIIPNSPYNPDYGPGTDSGGATTDILGSIKNGFGLLGDNGVFGLLSSVFSFVPKEIFAVILTGVSLSILIFILKFIRG